MAGWEKYETLKRNRAKAEKTPRTSSESASYRYDVFISYRRQEPDMGFAKDLLRRLGSEGITVAFDETDFRANEPFLEEMERCVKESHFTLCVVSPRYLMSGNCEAEARIRKVLDMKERKKRLIPLVLESATMPEWMYEITGIRFNDSDPLIDPFERLLKTLRTPD